MFGPQPISAAGECYGIDLEWREEGLALGEASCREGLSGSWYWISGLPVLRNNEGLSLDQRARHVCREGDRGNNGYIKSEKR